MKDILYASLVWSLTYAQACTRPDIAFAVGMLGRYQSNPGLDHWKAGKRVLRYLQGTKDLKFTYKYSDSLEVIGYSDSDLGGYKDTGKSTSGYIFLLAGGVVSWRSVKQAIVAISKMEAEFIACYKATSQALWLKNFISGLRIVDSISRPLRIFCDNSATVFFSKNNKSGSQSKHINIKYLMVRDFVKKQDVNFEHVSTTLMIVNPMTKGLSANIFKDHVTHMGLSSSI
ncbi:secreted RxLR effector protein 161-like [Nicotiana sylvestris]|uniref:secreted RxLR effector protein 161-like n=1 Tax=Nicotiana sylvestris TaxID=4096 RepID=UPI00388CC0E7